MFVFFFSFLQKSAGHFLIPIFIPFERFLAQRNYILMTEWTDAESDQILTTFQLGRHLRCGFFVCFCGSNRSCLDLWASLDLDLDRRLDENSCWEAELNLMRNQFEVGDLVRPNLSFWVITSYTSLIKHLLLCGYYIPVCGHMQKTAGSSLTLQPAGLRTVRPGRPLGHLTVDGTLHHAGRVHLPLPLQVQLQGVEMKTGFQATFGSLSAAFCTGSRLLDPGGERKHLHQQDEEEGQGPVPPAAPPHGGQKRRCTPHHKPVTKRTEKRGNRLWGIPKASPPRRTSCPPISRRCERSPASASWCPAHTRRWDSADKYSSLRGAK